MAVAFVDYASGIQSDSDSQTVEHTVPSGSDRLLVVIRACNPTYYPMDSCTFDGNALTKAVNDAYPVYRGVELWYRVLGTGDEIVADVVMDYPGTGNPGGIYIFLNYTGVDQSDPLGTTDSDYDQSDPTDANVDVTTDTANSMIIAGGVAYANCTWTADTGTTERAEETIQSLCDSFAAERLTTSAGSYNIGETASVGNKKWCIVAAEFHEVSAGAESQDSRAARTHGQATAQESRGARTHGSTESQDSRGARTHGQAEGQDSRAARTHGQAEGQDSRGVRTHGQTQGQDSRGARTHGQATDQANRGARTHGGASSQESRDARTHGQTTDQDSRGARTHGQAESQANRGARTHGGVSSQNSRGGRTHGQTTSQASRGARTQGAGGTVSSAYRMARTHGTFKWPGPPSEPYRGGFDYLIRVVERTSGNSIIFTKGEGVVSFDFELLRHGGCGAFSLQLYSENWSAGGTYLQAENFVEIWLGINQDFGAYPDYCGIITAADEPYCTPPKRYVRTIRGYGLWAELKDYLVLRAIDDETIFSIVGTILGDISSNTDVVTATSQIQVSDPYTIDRALYEDRPAADCIKQLAEVQTGIVYGVDARRRLFFKAERSQAVQAIINVALGDKDDGITSYQAQYTSPGPNAYIVEGRTAFTGNPMTVYEADVESGGRLRMKRIKAPELVCGSDLVTWAQFLIDSERDPRRRITIPFAGIEANGVARDVIDPNNNARIESESGGAIAQEMIRAVTYSMSGGSLNMSLEIGDDPELDLLDTADIRDMLRRVRVYEAKELSNQIEIANDAAGWPTEAYVEFVKNYQLRNSVRFALDNDHTLVNWDSSLTNGVCFEESLGGLTGIRGGLSEGACPFVTLPIETGRIYNQYAMYRRVVYPLLISTDPGGFRSKCDMPHASIGSIFKANEDADAIQPVFQFYSFAPQEPGVAQIIWPRNICFFCDHVVTMEWNQPLLGSTYRRRYYVFQYKDHGTYENYAAIEMYRVDETTMHWGLLKKIGDPPATTYGFSHNLAVDDGDELKLTIDLRTESIYANPLCMLENVTQGITSGPWEGGVHFLIEVGDELGFKCGFRAWSAYLGTGRFPDDWYIKKLTWDRVYEADHFWQLSRDGGFSWEGSWAPDTMELVDLGDYSGGFTALRYVLVKGSVSYPMTITHFALGWKQ